MAGKEHDWDAASYDHVSPAMEEMALHVLERLTLTGDEIVVDAGCGTGLITARLAHRLPRGKVIAVDASPAMVDLAGKRLQSLNVELITSDLCGLELDDKVDAIFSTATFHWIKDQAKLFETLHKLLRPGGVLVAQCGGKGQLQHELKLAGEIARGPNFKEHFAGWENPTVFLAPDEAEVLLSKAGFAEVKCWREIRKISPAAPKEYLATIVFRMHLRQLPKALRSSYLDEVYGRLPKPIELDYVRLNIEARKPPIV